MAWTAPRTWVAGETVTAAIMNQHVRDNLKALGDNWVSYTPAWTSTGTAPAIGNATVQGASITTGPKTIDFFFTITYGSTSTFGTGSYRFSLPVTAASRNAGSTMNMSGLLTDTGTAIWGVTAIRFVTTSTIELLTSTSATDPRLAVYAQTVPFTSANTDIVSVAGRYEAA